MGALPEEPEGFLTWARNDEPGLPPDQFASRHLYGSYLQALLCKTQEESTRATLRVVRDVVIDLTFDDEARQFCVELAQHLSLHADACILALGNIQRTTISGIAISSVFNDPYKEESYEEIEGKQSLLVVGTGLTAVDCILEAEGRGFKGRYVMLSRHARLPLPHEPLGTMQSAKVAPLFSSPDCLQTSTLSTFVKAFREEAKRLGSSQPIINAMRPHLQRIWHDMPIASKRRFLRHLRPLWEVHRHRIPETHAALVNDLRQKQRLSLVAGRLLSAKREHDAIEIEYLHEGRTSRDVFDIAFICAGPEGDISKVETPLIRNLVRRGIIQAGALGLGIDMSESSLSHAAKQRFKILGPLQREQLWEITAVREIRIEAAKIAKELYDVVSDI
jgi:uncharacterized NAD(P)/FAD-binding protein YdhS